MAGVRTRGRGLLSVSDSILETSPAAETAWPRLSEPEGEWSPGSDPTLGSRGQARPVL